MLFTKIGIFQNIRIYTKCMRAINTINSHIIYKFLLISITYDKKNQAFQKQEQYVPK